nr:hypothetical protein Ade03nite_92460 [Actinoplanes derwentensis]
MFDVYSTDAAPIGASRASEVHSVGAPTTAGTDPAPWGFGARSPPTGYHCITPPNAKQETSNVSAVVATATLAARPAQAGNTLVDINGSLQRYEPG